MAGFVVYFVTVALTVAGLRLKNKDSGFLSPLGTKRGDQVLAAQTTPKKIFGFLPFWNLKDLNTKHYDNVDVVYYFSLTVKATGEFDKSEPGYSRLKSAPKVGKAQGLTIACMKQADIEAVINNQAKRRRVIDNTIKIMAENNFTELNVDFEYVGVPPGNLSQNYTKFIQEAADAVHKTGGTVSVATLSDAVWKSRIYNIAEIGKAADYIIVMAYDFTRLPSASSGPVAPLFGREKFEYDVYTTMIDYLKNAPAQKIVLGVPFYGYEWPNVDNKPYSFTLNNSSFGPALSTIKRTVETIKETGATVVFDDLSKTPWISYFDAGSQTWRQVWFENERSIGLKLDLINQADLGGMAIWALGYEGYNPNLWGVIKDKIM